MFSAERFSKIYVSEKNDMNSDGFMSASLEADQVSLDTLRCGSSLSAQTATLAPQLVQIGVRCPETHFENIFSMKLTESVGNLRTRAVLRTSLNAWDAINYGLFLPAQGSKKGKFLEDERPIADYPALYRNRKNAFVDNTQSHSPDSGIGQEICWLELIYKSRLDAEEAVPTSRLRKLKAKTLLDLGQNPNCRDSNGLTPLYHAVSTDVSSRCTQTLLYDHAILGVEDSQGYQEIHQACKMNRAHHLENLIMYGADLNARTKKGHTPLHVCVMNEADLCLHLLLVRGADPSLTNEHGQTALEYCILTNRNALVQIFTEFKPEDVVLVTEPPAYNMDRRPTINGPRAAALVYSRVHNYTADSTAGSMRGSPLSMLDRMSIASADSLLPYNTLSSTYASLNQIRPTAGGVQSGFGPTLNSQMSGPMQTSFRSPASAYSATSIQTEESSIQGDLAFPTDKRFAMSSACQGIYAKASVEDNFLRTVVLQKGRDGFGFTLNGVPKAALERTDCHRHGFPGTQYFTSVLPGGPAAKAGIKPGDYVIEIDGRSVVDACHEEAVQWIHDAGDTLAMRVVTLTDCRVDPLRENSESDATSRSSSPPRNLTGTYPPSTIYDKRSRSQNKLDSGNRRRGHSMQPTVNDRAKIWSRMPSPAVQSKERVFIIQDIDGKKIAVPADENSDNFKTKTYPRSSSSRTPLSNSGSDSDDSSNTFTGHGSASDEFALPPSSKHFSSQWEVRTPHQQRRKNPISRSASITFAQKTFFRDGYELCIYDPNHPTQDVSKAQKMVPLLPRKFASTTDKPNFSAISRLMKENGA
nr:unnamed protein product [Spirometra erinaceieuropaei]